ncbi:MAG: GCN5-related N-acetyltransferase [Actinomycetia bacterium]|nr:GCN5-related N-acetyltransferase [Actinomycetes bacterium]
MDIIAVDDPSDDQIREWHDVVRAAHACDHPDGPVQTLAETSARLLGQGGGCRHLLWAAVEDGMAGVAYLRLPNEPGRAGEIDIQVRPRRRRQGIGSRLLAVAADGVRAGDCGTVISQVFADAPAVPFLESHGFRCVLTMRELVLRMSDVEPGRLNGVLRPGPPGYELVRWTGTVPDALADGFAEAKVAMAELPAGEQMRWDADRVREMAEMVAKRGDDLYTVAAVRGDHVAGFTEIVVPCSSPARAAQYDTVVVPEHRGRRLGIWVKAAMLEWLRAERPEVTEIETDNADDNQHMLAVNEELGFHKRREYREYLAEPADLPSARG